MKLELNTGLFGTVNFAAMTLCKFLQARLSQIFEFIAMKPALLMCRLTSVRKKDDEKPHVLLRIQLRNVDILISVVKHRTNGTEIPPPEVQGLSQNPRNSTRQYLCGQNQEYR